MKTLPEQIMELLDEEPGLTDREITNDLLPADHSAKPICKATWSLEKRGYITRSLRGDGLIANVRTRKPWPSGRKHDG